MAQHKAASNPGDNSAVSTLTETPHGVIVGPVEFEVLFTDEAGRVAVRVKNARGHIDVYSSPKGHSFRYYPSAGAKRGGAS